MKDRNRPRAIALPRRRNAPAQWLIASLLVLAALLIAGQASATLEHVEYAAEAESLDIFVVDDANGRINARRCDFCELLTLTVTPNTRILLDGRPVGVLDAERYRNDGATVLFDPETREVTRILLWHRPLILN